jgi:hypothetical protein
MNSSIDLRQLSYDFINNELEHLWEHRSLFISNARDLSIYGRSFLYGYRFLNYDAGAYILEAIKNYNL